MPGPQSRRQIRVKGVLLPHERSSPLQRTEIPVVLNVAGTGQMAVPNPIMWPEDDPWDTTVTYTMATAHDGETKTQINYIAFFAHSKDHPLNPVLAGMKMGAGVRGPVVIMAYDAATKRFHDLTNVEHILHAFSALDIDCPRSGPEPG